MTIRTFHPRCGRLSGRHRTALDQYGPLLMVRVPPADTRLLDLPRLFGRTAPVVLEIGSGMGDATADLATADPDRDYLAVEVHLPGVANLLSLAAERGLTNLRIAVGDALDLLRNQIAPGTLEAVNIFFPDPWPKKRHHKRRLITSANVGLLSSRLREGGLLRCATDWADYAESMLETLTADPHLVNRYQGYAPRPGDRPVTKFEERGLDAGRTIFDLVFERTGEAPGTP